MNDDELIERLHSALDEVHSIDTAATLPVAAAARPSGNGRWFAVAAAVALVAVGVAAIAVNRGTPAPGNSDSLVASTTVAPSTPVSTVPHSDAEWFELQLDGFTAAPMRHEACCIPVPAPGPATVMAWGDVNGIDHGVLMLRLIPALGGGPPMIDWKWRMMSNDRALALTREAVPGSGLPYVLPSQSMQLIGNGLAGMGNLRGQMWSDGTGSVDITVGDYRGQLDQLISGDVEATTIAGHTALRLLRPDGGDNVVWQTAGGQWATVTIGEALADREDEILAAIVPADLGPDLTMPSTSVPSSGAIDGTAVLRGGASIIDSGNGPMLANVLLASLPPQGGDVPVQGFDWSMVDDEQTVAGVTWTESWYIFTGTWDGTTFHLLEPPVAYVPVKSPPAPDLTPTPNCTEADLMPLLDDMQAKLQPRELHISEWAGVQTGGRCGADVTAWFDTAALRHALAPFGDRVHVTYLFEAMHR